MIDSGRNGYVDTRLPNLVGTMRELLRDHGLAAEWGRAGQRDARERFGIARFVADWLAVFDRVAGRRSGFVSAAPRTPLKQRQQPALGQVQPIPLRRA